MAIYRCPKCGGASLRVEVLVVAALIEDDLTELVGDPGLSDDAWTSCNSEGCEHSGKLGEFITGAPTRQAAEFADDAALNRIFELLDGTEWDSDTAGDIAEVVTLTGRGPIREPQEVDDDD